jgi:hypothetical protein
MSITTIVKKDGIVTVDGYFTNDQDFSAIASNIHAIQWDTSTNKGHIEYTDGTANEDITSISSDMQTLITDCQTAKTASETAIAKVISDAADADTAEKATYEYKRKQEYPSDADQTAALPFVSESSDEFLNHLLLEIQLHHLTHSNGDMFDKLYHAGKFNADMTAKIKAVKDKYPK